MYQCGVSSVRRPHAASILRLIDTEMPAPHETAHGDAIAATHTHVYLGGAQLSAYAAAAANDSSASP